MPKVIYLTGAPASGKSSTARLLAGRVSGLLVWEYGARLTEHVMNRSRGIAGQDDLRARSAGVVTPEDVAAAARYRDVPGNDVRNPTSSSIGFATAL